MLGERVFDARRNLRVNLPADDLVPFQFSQLLDKHLLGGGGYQALQLAEAARPTLQKKENGGFPLSADDAGSQADWAVRVVHGWPPWTLVTKKYLLAIIIL